jgi:hypothetical protein
MIPPAELKELEVQEMEFDRNKQIVDEATRDLKNSSMHALKLTVDLINKNVRCGGQSIPCTMQEAAREGDLWSKLLGTDRVQIPKDADWTVTWQHMPPACELGAVRREIAEATLMSAGYADVVTADSAWEALHILDVWRPKFDVVLLDIVMPKMKQISRSVRVFETMHAIPTCRLSC